MLPHFYLNRKFDKFEFQKSVNSTDAAAEKVVRQTVELYLTTARQLFLRDSITPKLHLALEVIYIVIPYLVLLQNSSISNSATSSHRFLQELEEVMCPPVVLARTY